MKFETNSNYQNLNDQNKNCSSKQFGAFVLNFEHYNFGFCICLKQRDFDIRISDLLVLSQCHSCQANCLIIFHRWFHEGDPCPGQIEKKRKMANRIPDPVFFLSFQETIKGFTRPNLAGIHQDHFCIEFYVFTYCSPFSYCKLLCIFFNKCPGYLTN